jgi:hypothetical protein
MIKEVKLDKKYIKKKSNELKKKHFSNGKKIHKKTKKNMKGGFDSRTKDNFEVTTLSNIDPSKFSISRYVNSNIDWQGMPGPPPVDCVVM